MLRLFYAAATFVVGLPLFAAAIVDAGAGAGTPPSALAAATIIEARA